jgi:hypothetical protein
MVNAGIEPRVSQGAEEAEIFPTSFLSKKTASAKRQEAVVEDTPKTE